MLNWCNIIVLIGEDHSQLINQTTAFPLFRQNRETWLSSHICNRCEGWRVCFKKLGSIPLINAWLRVTACVTLFSQLAALVFLSCSVVYLHTPEILAVINDMPREDSSRGTSLCLTPAPDLPITLVYYRSELKHIVKYFAPHLQSVYQLLQCAVHSLARLLVCLFYN